LQKQIMSTHTDVKERFHLHLRLIVQDHFLLHFLPVEDVVDVTHGDK
jgi:hypothetical protein